MRKTLIDLLATSEIHKKFLALLPDNPNLLDLDEEGALISLRKALPLEEAQLYDGIWSSIYLKQLSKAELHALLEIVCSALIPGGYFFCALKYGKEENKQIKKACDLYDEISFSNLLARHKNFTKTKLWRRGNSETGYKGDTLYCLIEKNA